MKLGFALLTHQVNEHLPRLLRQLRRCAGAEFAVHHDYSKSSFPEEFIRDFGVRMVRSHRETPWASAAFFHAMMDAFQLLYEADSEIEWFIPLSGSCYPIKPASEINRVFMQASVDAFINCEEVGPARTGHLYWRYGVLARRRLFKYPSLTRRLKPCWRHFWIPNPTYYQLRRRGYRFAAGSDWFSLRRNVVDWVLHLPVSEDPAARFICEVNRELPVCPSEMVIQTLLRSQGSRFRLSNDNLRYIDWTNSQDWHPNTLTMQHWPALSESSAIFARKFHPERSAELLAKIDQRLRAPD